ncbi:MAG: threonine dehydratase [Alphaproteobacteria bacterium]|nr:threonine dehydratase [Alphaproteobacteria bacterium]
MITASLSELEAAAEQIRPYVSPTLQYCWPLLSARCGAEVWVKHENHTPIGAFKVRGGLVYLQDWRQGRPEGAGVITATRGNHGQSIGFAAARTGVTATIVVPKGNSVEKNAAMKALGVDLVVHGSDFQDAFEYAQERAAADGLHLLPSFHPLLVRGVGTYALELFRAAGELDTVYVPIGLGSGICGVISARDALGLGTAVVGVVAEGAPCYALSFEAERPVSTNNADTMADGLAVRVPDPDAVATILRGADRIVAVSDDEIQAAMRHYFTDTHNVAEGAGAATLAAALREKRAIAGKRVGLVLSGGNVDMDVYRQILADS